MRALFRCFVVLYDSEELEVELTEGLMMAAAVVAVIAVSAMRKRSSGKFLFDQNCRPAR